VAANKVVVELTNTSFANFIVLDMKKMQLMMKETHTVTIPTARCLCNSIDDMRRQKGCIAPASMVMNKALKELKPSPSSEL
jgi:hypothetical protein